MAYPIMSSEYHYGYRRRGPLTPMPWKDEEGFDRYFCEQVRKFNHLTVEQVMEYDRSMRQAAHAAYLSERETDPSLPIRYPTLTGMIEDDAADFCLEVELEFSDPEEIIPEGSSSPNSIDYYPKPIVLRRRIKKNPSPHASTDASAEQDEAATFGEAKKNLHFLARDSRTDYASVNGIAKVKRMMNKRRRMMNKKKRMMNKSRNFPYRSFYLLKRNAGTAS